jgi:hypothetical protein
MELGDSIMEKEGAAGKEVAEDEEEEEVDEGEESVQFLQSAQQILYCPSTYPESVHSRS